MTYKDYQDELYHHGIKGMRWGVRRYQNADGTLTDLGKRHQNIKDADRNIYTDPEAKSMRDRAIYSQVSSDYAMNSGVAKQISTSARSASNISRRMESKKRERNIWKDASSMTDQDLQKAVNRMNLERNYNSLQYDKINAGKTHTSDVLDTVGDVAAIGASVAIMASVIYKIKSL